MYGILIYRICKYAYSPLMQFLCFSTVDCQRLEQSIFSTTWAVLLRGPECWALLTAYQKIDVSVQTYNLEISYCIVHTKLANHLANQLVSTFLMCNRVLSYRISSPHLILNQLLCFCVYSELRFFKLKIANLCQTITILCKKSTPSATHLCKNCSAFLGESCVCAYFML